MIKTNIVVLVLVLLITVLLWLSRLKVLLKVLVTTGVICNYMHGLEDSHALKLPRDRALRFPLFLLG